jgi:PAS domain S-box-containing protein
MRGLRPEDVRPHIDSWVSGLHVEDWPRVQRTLDEYLEGRRSDYEAEFRVRTASGDWIWILDRGKVFARDRDGQAVRMVGTELDITVRTLAISNARLCRCTRAIETRDKLLAIVSHDLRAPLVAIDWLIKLLRRQGGVDEKRLVEFVDNMQRSIADLHLLIDDLMDVARIHSGTFAVEMGRERVLDVVKPALDGMRAQADRKRQALEMNISTDLPEVIADARRIRQVVSNLLGNAVNYTSEGGTIRVSAMHRDGSVEISVWTLDAGFPGTSRTRL